MNLLLIKISLKLQNKIIAFLKLILFNTVKKYEKVNVKNILILRNGSLGDSICSLPAIYNIRQNYSHAHITILYNNGGSHLASIEGLIDHSLVDDFINYNGKSKKALINLFKQKNYDLFIELPQAHQPFKSHIRNILFAKFVVKAKSAYGWHIYHSRLFPQSQAKKDNISNVRTGFLKTLKRNGLKIYDKDIYPLGITNEIKIKINQLLSTQIPNYSKPKTIAIVPGAKRPQNRWPIQNFAKVVQYLIQKGYRILVVGGKEDQLLANKIIEALQSPITNHQSLITDFTGKLTPLESAELLSRCQLLITNDTGPMHLAYAVNTYSIAIFSSRDYPNLWYPPEEISTVFRNNNIYCSECFTETCKDNICIQAITPQMVIEEAKSLLEIE